MKFHFGLMFCLLAILPSDSIANNFCRSSDDLKYVTWVSALEIIDENRIRVIAETGAPVYILDVKGNAIESGILGLSDRIELRDEHYGAEFKIVDVTQEAVSFAVHESWSYPVSGKCNPGQYDGTILIRPYDIRNDRP